MATSGFFVFSHIFFDKSIRILLTIIKVTFLNPVNIYLQDVPVILVCLVVISVSFLVISVIPGDFGNSWHPVCATCTNNMNGSYYIMERYNMMKILRQDLKFRIFQFPLKFYVVLYSTVFSWYNLHFIIKCADPSYSIYCSADEVCHLIKQIPWFPHPAPGI